MSAIDVFTAIAIAAVGVYLARDSTALALGLVLAAGGLLLARGAPTWIAAWRAWRTRPFDRWLDRLPTPIARYPRARSTSASWLAVFVSMAAALFLTSLYARSDFDDTPFPLLAFLGANALLWHALRGRATETWLYEDRLAVVDGVLGPVWWPFDQIRHLRCYRWSAAGKARVEWTDGAFRTLLVAESACAAHVAGLLEQGAVDALAHHMAAPLRGGNTHVFDVSRARGPASTVGFGLGVVIWIAASMVGEIYQRQAASDRVRRRDAEVSVEGQRAPRRERVELWDHEIARERALDRDLTTVFAAAIPVCVVLALVVEWAWSRSRSRRVTLARTGLYTRGGRRSLAWQDVRRVGHSAMYIRLEGETESIEIDRRAWDAVLVPRVAAILGAEASPTS